MIKLSDIKRQFASLSGWSEAKGLFGDFSYTPDDGRIRRVFVADVKARSFGRMLLGAIGYYAPEARDDDGVNLYLLAYITNFEEFSPPPAILDESSLKYWIKKICQGVDEMPSAPSGIVQGIHDGMLGIFNCKFFFGNGLDKSRFMLLLENQGD